MNLQRCYAWLFLGGFLVVLPTSQCFAQMGVDSGLGLRWQKANCNFNLGWWRTGEAPTGVLIRETGNLLTGIAPYAVPTIQAIGGLSGTGLTDSLGGGGDESGGRDDEDFVVEDYDPNFEKRQTLLVEIENRQDVLMAKLGITDFKRRMGSIEFSELPSNEGDDGEGDGLAD